MTLLLVLLALAVGLGAGVLLGRQRVPAHDDSALDAARVELTEVHRALADARVETAQAQSEVAVARTERDNALARVDEAAQGQRAMVEQFKLISHEVAEIQRKAADSNAQQRLQATEQLMAPVSVSLQQLQARLTEVEKDRTRMAAELNGQVRAVRDTGEALRKETAALVTALRKPQVRGAWGETQLKRVAEIAGMVERCDFDLQSSSRDDEDRLRRPDMKVLLGEGKHIVVDSKVPLSAFLDAAETDEPGAKNDHMQSFAGHVRKHVEQLSGKQYWKTAESPEFVVLFMPSEAFFAAALDRMPDLYEFAADRNVIIATPTMLIGLLRAISYGWRQAALAEDAKEIADLGQLLYERLGTMGSKFDKLGRALGSAVGAYNDTVASVEGRLLVTARRFRDLSVTEKELPAPAQIETTIKQIQQPELVDDAVQVEPMVGRTPRTRRTSEPPEAEALWRMDPGVDELVAGEAEQGQSGESAVGS
jgi:DNA recombination protein RmuC